MTDGISVVSLLLTVVKAVGPFWLFMLVGGPLGLMIAWGFYNMRWVDRRDERFQDRLNQVLAENQKNIDRVLEQFRHSQVEFNQKYDSNVVLVKETQRLTEEVVLIAKELSSVIVLNTQIQTRLAERIEHNMFCPIASGRVDLRDLRSCLEGGK